MLSEDLFEHDQTSRAINEPIVCHAVLPRTLFPTKILVRGLNGE